MPDLLTPAARLDIDQIWSYLVTESGSQEIADRLIDTIYGRVALLADFPYLGRDRSSDLGLGTRSFSVGEYVIVYRLKNDLSATGSILVGCIVLVIGLRVDKFYAAKGPGMDSGRLISTKKGRLLFVAVGLFFIAIGVMQLFR